MATIFHVPFNGRIKRDFSYYDLGHAGEVLSTNPSNSVLNDFIPYHALMSGRLLSLGELKALTYNLDFNQHIDFTYKTYEHFFKALVTGNGWCRLVKKNIRYSYRCRAGQLILVSNEKVVTPLVTLVINKEHLFSVDKENPDLSKFFIVVTRQFSESKEHSILYKNFCNYYLNDASNYVDVIYVNSIVDFCYKRVPITPIKPKTIAESKVISKDITHSILQALSNSEFI